MSRVDDDREEARTAERLMQQRRMEEARRTDKSAQDSQFARLVTQTKEAATKADEQVSARSAIEELLAEHDAETRGEARAGESRGQNKDADQRRFGARLGAQSADKKFTTGARADGQKAASAKTAAIGADSDAAGGRNKDSAASGKTGAGRASDAKAGSQVLSDRAKASDDADSAQGAKASDEKGDIKADADKGGGGGKQQGGGDKKGGDMPASFRFNPALAPPVPVAQKNTMAGSDRLRRIATEIAQKIVERVRVGTNAAGNAEFQIDLRSNVLSGLQVKVSAKNGRISAIFSGSDKEVLKMLEQNEEALKNALTSRGLLLDKFKVEAKA
jgi:hypothetical protein